MPLESSFQDKPFDICVEEERFLSYPMNPNSKHNKGQDDKKKRKHRGEDNEEETSPEGNPSMLNLQQFSIVFVVEKESDLITEQRI